MRTYKFCKECKNKSPRTIDRIPAALFNLDDDCGTCMGWMISPIPACEVGIPNPKLVKLQTLYGEIL